MDKEKLNQLLKLYSIKDIQTLYDMLNDFEMFFLAYNLEEMKTTLKEILDEVKY